MSNPQLTLCGISPVIEGLRWESATLLRIGRLNSLQVVINHSSISREHAEVIVRGQGGVVRDLGSAKGTFINGVPVGRSYQKLRHQDTLQCGDVVLRVLFAQAEAGEKATPLEPAAPEKEPTDSSNLRTTGSFLTIQATSQHSWEQALEMAPLRREEQLNKGNHLLGLLRMGHYLCHMNSLSELLQSILEDTVAVLGAQRGCIILADEATEHLDLHAIAFSKQPMSCSKTFSRTLAQHCYSQGKSLLCRDVNLDKELQRSGSIAHGSIASVICVLLRSPRKRLGVLHLDRGPIQEAFSQDDFQLADAIAASMSYGIENAQLAESQRELFVQTVTALAQAVELRDQYTGNHTQRVTQYSLMLAHELQLSPTEYKQIQIATPLHDIGKIAIDDAILRKPGKLTPGEFEQMKSHVLKGAAILEPIPGMKPMIPIVRNHHERWDGSGYPDRLRGDRIPRLARVVAVADAFDAMTSDRPYRHAMPLDRAFGELASKAGIHFDPECAQAFLRLRHHVEVAMAKPAGAPQISESLTDTCMRTEILRLVNQGPKIRPRSYSAFES